MRIEKYQDHSDKVIPVIAALPYRLTAEADGGTVDSAGYDPSKQRTIYAGRDYSTSREDESIGALNPFAKSRSDTKKDD